MLMRPLLLVLFLTSLLCLNIVLVFSAVPVLGQSAFNQIALSGDLVPGAVDGAQFRFFGNPAINDLGDVTFDVELETGPSGVPVTRDNDFAIIGPTAGAGSALGLVAREGALVPFLDGAEFSTIVSPTLNNSGDLAFSGFLRTGVTGTPITRDNDYVIFGPTAGVGSGLGIIAREGEVPPGVADGVVFSFISHPTLNDFGDVAFSTELERSGAPLENRIGSVFGPAAGAGAVLGPYVMRGEIALGVSDTPLFYTVSNQPGLNNSGDVAFSATFQIGTGSTPVTTDNDSAIFGPTAGAGSALGIIAREDNIAPGTGGALFASFDSSLIPVQTLRAIARPSINDLGDVAFSAVLRSGPGGTPVVAGNDAALFQFSSGQLELIVREGEIAPGTNGAEFRGFDNPAINASGDLVFEAIIGSTSAGSNQSGLFSLVDGEIKLILIEGSLLDITVDAVTEQRIVRSAREIDDLNDNFNNAGVLALYLTFEDGSEGIFTTAVSSLKGDVDLSGVVDFADIPAFIGVLQAGVFQAEADANCDTFVNFADIPAFIAILQGQG